MVLRPRPAAAFFALSVFACLAVSLTTEVVSAQAVAGMIPLTRQPAADGTISLWEISPARAESLAPWDPRTGTPPLSVDAAMKAAEAWLKQQHPEIATFEPFDVTLLRLRRPDRWYYRLAFDGIVGSKRVSLPAGLVAIVLFDGSVVEPRVEKSGAVSGGVGSGTAGGGGPRIFPAPSPDAGGVYAPGNRVTSPQVVQRTRVNYTQDALRAKIQGTVWLEVVVNADGMVGDVKVVRSLDSVHGLDNEAVKTVRQWRFTPGTLDGVPVPVRTTVEMSFSIR